MRYWLFIALLAVCFVSPAGSARAVEFRVGPQLLDPVSDQQGNGASLQFGSDPLAPILSGEWNQPTGYDFQTTEIVLDFNESLPQVTVAPFSVQPFSGVFEAQIQVTPFRTETVRVSVDPGGDLFSFSGGVFIVNTRADGSLTWPLPPPPDITIDFVWEALGHSFSATDIETGVLDMVVTLDPVTSAVRNLMLELSFGNLTGGIHTASTPSFIDPVTGEDVNFEFILLSGANMDLGPLQPIPEPGTALLMGVGLGTVGLLAAWKRA